MLVWLLIYLGLVVLLKPYIIEISLLLFAFGWILQFLDTLSKEKDLLF